MATEPGRSTRSSTRCTARSTSPSTCATTTSTRGAPGRTRPPCRTSMSTSTGAACGASASMRTSLPRRWRRSSAPSAGVPRPFVPPETIWRMRKQVLRSLVDKVWDAHVVEELPGGNALVFMDLVVAHEITTPPGAIAIEKEFDDKLYEPGRIVAMIDHVAPAKDAATALQAQTVRTWAKRQGIRFHDIGNNGICHVLVPERGYVSPGMTVCCGDSHTCTLGAFGAFALGIGTTAQAGAMLAGCLILQRPNVMRVEVTGELQGGATAKDLALTVIATIGFRGGTGYVLEYTGSAIRALTMEQRMTLCNMAIEAGATTGMIAADATTAAYLAAIPNAPAYPLDL